MGVGEGRENGTTYRDQHHSVAKLERHVVLTDFIRNNVKPCVSRRCQALTLASNEHRPVLEELGYIVINIGRPQIDFEKDNIDGKYMLIVAQAVAEHIVNIPHFFKQISNALSSGGMAILQNPMRRLYPTLFYDGKTPDWDCPDHKRIFGWDILKMIDENFDNILRINVICPAINFRHIILTVEKR